MQCCLLYILTIPNIHLGLVPKVIFSFCTAIIYQCELRRAEEGELVVIMENYWSILSVRCIITVLVTIILLVGDSGSMSEVVEMVERRSSRDIYVSANKSIICLDVRTYLVKEDECVNNEELMKGTCVYYRFL